MTKDLQTLFGEISDHMQADFDGIGASFSRYGDGLESMLAFNRAVHAYIFEFGPRPIMSFENSSQGQSQPIEGTPDGNWPRVVEQVRESNNNSNGADQDYNPPLPGQVTYPVDERKSSIADYVAQIGQQRRESGR